MKYVDEFRDEARAKAAIAAITRAFEPLRRDRPTKIMEVCGGHTHAIFRYGIEEVLPEGLELVHGPGCPVCVLPRGRIDDCLAIARKPSVILTTFGDAMRVPGSSQSLLGSRAEGADVRMVYSAMDALALAKKHPDREVVFFAIGFETTMPATAFTVLTAAREGIHNFSVFCNHITIVPTIKAILDGPELGIDAFLGPGHVAMVVGTRPFEFVAERYKKPMVVGGFEPLDVLASIHRVLTLLTEKRAVIENVYGRAARDEGNVTALRALATVFELRAYFEWRGLGSIDHSGVRLKKEFAAFDAELKFDVKPATIADPLACQCGEVLKGAIKPWQCKVFGTSCTPDVPLGALMVSSEGACAAYYRYGDRDRLVQLSRRDAAPNEPA